MLQDYVSNAIKKKKKKSKDIVCVDNIKTKKIHKYWTNFEDHNS